jgi:hypothetical protein
MYDARTSALHIPLLCLFCNDCHQLTPR